MLLSPSVVRVTSLQMISQLLRNQWTLSLALDDGPKLRTSCLDFCVRFEHGRHLHNLLLLSIPLFDRNTTAVTVETGSTLLDVMAPKWKTHLIGISTDGERSTSETNLLELQQRLWSERPKMWTTNWTL